jgi:hypothetical protein
MNEKHLQTPLCKKNEVAKHSLLDACLDGIGPIVEIVEGYVGYYPNQYFHINDYDDCDKCKDVVKDDDYSECGECNDCIKTCNNSVNGRIFDSSFYCHQKMDTFYLSLDLKNNINATILFTSGEMHISDLSRRYGYQVSKVYVMF